MLLRSRVLEMLAGSEQRWLYSGLERQLDPPAIGRLDETDVPDIDQLAHLIVQHVPGAVRVYIQDLAHMVNMEKPTEFNGVLMGFLERF